MQYRIPNFIILIFVLILVSLAQDQKKQDIPTLTVPDVMEKIAQQDSMVLLDVRSKQEHHGPTGNLKGSTLIPLPELESRLVELDSLRDKEIIIYCASGIRSLIGTKILRDAGFNAYSMIGGMKAWNKLKN